MTATSPDLRTTGVRVHFGGVKAVDGVDLEFRPGEILGLIGPNGAGKTTFVNALSGFVRLTEGSIEIGGTDVTNWPAHKLARFGLARTFQSPRFFRSLTVLQNVELGAVGTGRPKRQAEARARELLEVVALADKAEQSASSLAYGEERRLELARAAATEPQFLLLDEPAAGLSEGETDQLATEIVGLRDRLACGVLVIEHDMRLIMRVCDRIHVLAEGRTLSIGTPDEIKVDDAVMTAYLGHPKTRHDDA